MKREQTILLFTVLCFLLLIGIYIGAYYGYQQLQAYKQQYLGDNSALGKAGGLLSMIFGK